MPFICQFTRLSNKEVGTFSVCIVETSYPSCTGTKMLSSIRPVTVLLVSQPGIMHNTLYSILQNLPNTLVAQAYGALTGFDFLESGQADAVLIDANIPLPERIALIKRICERFPQVRSIVLTATTRNHLALTTAGAAKILSLDCSPDAIRSAVFAD